MSVVFDILKAFLFGGAFCIIAQILIDKTMLTPAKILVLYVVAGVFLGAVGIYEHVIDIAGAGGSVPLTGFGYNISLGMKKAIDEKGIFGILTGALTAASGGTCAALCLGTLSALICKSKRQ